MGLDASSFIRGRLNNSAITEKRITNILNAVINSYYKIKNDKKVFDYSTRGKIKQEDFLRNRFVDDFLPDQLNNINDGTFIYLPSKETNEEYYTIKDGILHNDPIDIHISIIDSTNSWNRGKRLYFAIECKRFNSGTVSAYINDIKKFTERNYTQLRLPFEGQVGFVEKANLTAPSLVKSINKRLNTKDSPITTLEALKAHTIQEHFDSSYKSKHQKLNKTNFEIFHLFLDYSELIKH